jgi:hypothetical protein
MDYSQKRNVNVVKWMDQNEDEPIPTTIAKCEVKLDIQPVELGKVTIHKRLPSNRLKSIIKYTNNPRSVENNIVLPNSQVVSPNKISMELAAIQFLESDRQSQYENPTQHQYQNYQYEMDDLVRENINHEYRDSEQVSFRSFTLYLGQYPKTYQ